MAKAVTWTIPVAVVISLDQLRTAFLLLADVCLFVMADLWERDSKHKWVIHNARLRVGQSL